MNLINEKYWQYELPWGNTINPNTNNQIAMSKDLVKFENGQVICTVKNEDTPCWKRGPNWEVVQTTAPWAIGHMVAKEEARTHYGVYKFKFRLPNFRGSWPAIWFIDPHDVRTQGGMGIPPELDVFEHFREDCFKSRFNISQTFHGGPTYEDNHAQQTFYKRWLPLDWFDIEMELIWISTRITIYTNGKMTFNIPSTFYNFPTKPMNLLIGAGIGTMWKPKTPKPFIVKQIEYAAI